MIEVRPTTPKELGPAETRSLHAFQEACRRRGSVPRSVSWNPKTGWSDGWGRSLYHRRLATLAKITGLPL